MEVHFIVENISYAMCYAKQNPLAILELELVRVISASSCFKKVWKLTTSCSEYDYRAI